MSGSTAGGIVGGVIGYYATGTMQGAQMGFLIGSAVGGYIKPDVIKGQRLSDATLQTTMEGAPCPIIFGRHPVAGNIIQRGPRVEHQHEDRTGKGGPVQESFTYTMTFAIRVCEPISEFLRVWQDGKLVCDRRNPADYPAEAAAINAMAGDTQKFLSLVRFYKGDEGQMPDPSLEALPPEFGGGVGNVPAYRGRAYMVGVNFPLRQDGSIPQFLFEVAACADEEVIPADELPGWSHGDTGLLQTIFDADMNDKVFLVAGWNNNLRRSTDGVTWDAVNYLADTGWAPGDAITNIWYSESEGLWFMSKFDKIARSSNQGGLWGIWGTPRHHIVDRTVTLVNGSFWAGASNVDSSIIFRPGQLEHAEDVDYGPHGIVTALGSIDSVTYVGTADGNILVSPDEVLYTAPAGIRRIVGGNGIIMVVLESGGYLTQHPGDIEFQYHGVGTVADAIWTNYRFYRTSGHSIESSPDAQPDTWTTVDNYFSDNDAGAYLSFWGDTIFGVIQGGGKTAVSPFLVPIPDLPGWFVDAAGLIYAPERTVFSACEPTLGEIVLDLCSRVDVFEDRVDVSELTDSVFGYMVGRQVSAGEAIRSLQPYYTFDFPEWGNNPDTFTKLRGIKRGGDIAFNIPDEDDIVDADDDENPRPQAIEFPRKINLVTSDIDANYNPTVQPSRRRTTNVMAVGEATVEITLATRRVEAAQKSDIMLKVMWTEAEGRLTRTLPPEYSMATASDAFMFDQKRWRAETVEYLDGCVKVKAVRDRIKDYSSLATPSDIQGQNPPVSSLRGPTMFWAGNLPRLRSADNVPGIYVGACGILDGWAGADLYLSTDGGVSEQLVLTMTNEATLGRLTEDVTATGEPITVKVYPHGELESVTSEQLGARQNGIALGSGEDLEVGQFQDADETITPDEYELTNNIRGALGTTAVPHYAGAPFALLDGAIYFLRLDANLIGQTLIFRPVTRGTAPANNPTYSVVFLPLFTGPEVVDFLVTNTGTPITADDGSYIQVTIA